MNHDFQWTEQKITQRLQLISPLVYRQRAPLGEWYWHECPDASVADALLNTTGQALQQRAWRKVPANSYWGHWAENFVLQNQFVVPDDWESEQPLALYLPLGEAGDIFAHPEALVYIDGQRVASCDRYHQEIPLQAAWCTGKAHQLALQGWTGLSGWPPDPDSQTQLYMRQCAVVQLDLPTREFVQLARTMLDSVQQLDQHHPSRGLLLTALHEAFLVLDSRDPLPGEAFYQSVPAALACLREAIAQLGEPLPVQMLAVGHAHIDVAYLWQIEQTRAKCARTFSNVLQLMEQEPGFHFSQSMPQLYRYIEQDHPDIFAQIKQRVAEGRWEIMGGMWVEPDCNLPGGESLVRQLMLGRQYFQQHFGDAETPVLWLPDVFGFCWSLPQLMQQAGIKWFVTNKLNWNQYNPMPNQLFRWRGIDGSEVIAHYLTTPAEVQHLPFPTTYKAQLTAKEVMGTWQNFRQKAQHQSLMIAYGYGDGGGGPTQEQIAQAQNLHDMPGMPQVLMGTVREFFEDVEHNARHPLPVWNDELYMEGHRGVYTSEAKNKRLNRDSERALHDTEFLCVMAVLLGDDYEYPHEALREAWELVCLNQFHDILPGTSIPEVFVDSYKDYERVFELVDRCVAEALVVLGERFGGGGLLVNTTGFLRKHPHPPAPSPSQVEGGNVPPSSSETQSQNVPPSKAPLPIRERGWGEGGATLSPYSITSLRQTTSTATPNKTQVIVQQIDAGIILENPHLKTTINPNGELTTLYDKTTEREVIAPGETGNQLWLFEDRPLNWDAWDIDVFFTDRPQRITELAQAIQVTLTETSPTHATITIDITFAASHIQQQIRLNAHSKRIDFINNVDWHEQHQLLKVAFPVDIHQTQATYDIQWGNIQRPTHRNTSWDQARFEVPAHKWADLSEADYGVALLNDCKYGYDTEDNVMRLSLIKSATMPNPQADQGKHEFTYSLLPHEGDWRGEVYREAYDLNYPLRRFELSEQAVDQAATNQPDIESLSLVQCNQEHVIIETIKMAEDNKGFIVRLFECERRRGKVRLTFLKPLSEVWRCNLLEQDQQPVTVEGSAVEFTIKPYEIVSLRCVFS